MISDWTEELARKIQKKNGQQNGENPKNGHNIFKKRSFPINIVSCITNRAAFFTQKELKQPIISIETPKFHI